jgi:hypothetical protein
LQLGRYAQVVAELPGMVLEHPFDERLRELHMLALHGAGRQADALAVYRDARRVLNEQLGTEPGVGLREAHRRVLAGGHPSRSSPAGEIAVRGPSGPSAGRGAPEADGAAASAADALPAPDAATAGARWSRGVRPAQLPPRVEHLVGRAAELEALLDWATNRATPASPVGIVHGMPGIGKTAVAVACAHLLVPEFPDGQLYIDLRGFDPRGGPTDPSQALADLLASMGVAECLIPASLSARAAQFRSMLAGRRMLLLLDNARDAEQVRPLLPGASGCRTLITSRNPMSGLIASHSAQSVPLPLLRDEEAAGFLTATLGAHRPGLEQGPDIADLTIERCAGLPLALAIVAARLAADTPASSDEIVQALAAGGTCLDAFVLGGDAAMDARAVFSWSYRVLGVRAARLFRLLCTYQCNAITAAEASSLAGLGVRETRESLAELASVHLVSARPGGRYLIHELLRTYGMELAAKYDRN